jgi:hypothetical protein
VEDNNRIEQETGTVCERLLPLFTIQVTNSRQFIILGFLSFSSMPVFIGCWPFVKKCCCLSPETEATTAGAFNFKKKKMATTNSFFLVLMYNRAAGVTVPFRESRQLP